MMATCGGITLQVHDYHTGFLVYSPAGAAYRIRYLLRYVDKRQRMGQIGREFVREHFLLTRNLRDYFSMLFVWIIPRRGPWWCDLGTRVMAAPPRSGGAPLLPHRPIFANVRPILRRDSREVRGKSCSSSDCG